MNIPADPQVARKTKRYYDPQPSMKRTNILRIILLLSSLVIGGVVVFLIVYFVTRKPQLIPPPSGQTISDELFSDYLQTEKAIYAWSHTSQSKLDGLPAYSSLLSNADNAFDYLLNFTDRHTIKTIYLYGGCAQWDSDTWAKGTLPFSSSLENAIKKAKLKGYTVNLVAYLNDDANNMTNYASIEKLSTAIVAMNKNLGSQGIDSVSLKISPTQPEAYAYSLEAYQLAQSILRPAGISLEGIALPEESLAHWAFRPELYVNLGVTSTILQIINEGRTLTYAVVLSALVDIINVVATTTSEYTLIEQWDKFLELSKEIRPHFDVSVAPLKEAVATDPASFLRTLPQLTTLCRTYESVGHSCGRPSLSSYLDYHTGLYILEPINSDARYLADIYYNNGR
ncbi:hypothetical protein GL50803_0016078 [Giardia duodenalis]|uniref:Uncharacterized protein n=1 Tax=Giardia intestinalis (strain ATCC 50803 / WB clone C6) TaxID=184922 RepID=A8BYC8_GIAIC|nr:hypothetical protein GL50803_0016078 [Giardia intestinalis]KAE8304792.1 hypothetical protein GL50803_0016078 [Giardia intestinalis]|eukprot:XP_001704201.1 Hypothetical protein GL50803_16078 [Giardia lamblia ATCC 50803]